MFNESLGLLCFYGTIAAMLFAEMFCFNRTSDTNNTKQAFMFCLSWVCLAVAFAVMYLPSTLLFEVGAVLFAAVLLCGAVRMVVQAAGSACKSVPPGARTLDFAAANGHEPVNYYADTV